MRFIFEGTDLTGKTTISQEMSRVLSVPRVTPWIDLTHTEAAITSVSRTLLPIFNCCLKSIIFDRFYFSEYVYGSIRGRNVDYIFSLLNEWSQVEDILVVHLTSSDEILRQRYLARNDYLWSIDQIILARDHYSRFIGHLPPNMHVITIDTGNFTINQAVQYVIESAQR